jgi:FkbM family methyltransferase
MTMKAPPLYRRGILHAKAVYFDTRRKFAPVIIRDNFGIKVRLYPFDTLPIKKLLTRENFKYEFSMYEKYAHGTVVDAGANLGITAVYLSRLAEKVYAFEPVPQTYSFLQETIQLNDRKNIEAIPSALGNMAGTLEMQIFPSDKSGWNSAFVPRTEESHPVSTKKVPIVRLDEFARERHIDRIGFLKIDVEGYELEVLRGAEALLRGSRIDALSFEVTPFHTTDASAIFDLLSVYGYRTTEPYTPSESDQNYFAVRKGLA